MSKDNLYGSAHQTKWPYQKRILDLFQEFEANIFSTTGRASLGDSLADLRNELVAIIDEIYQYLAIELKHNLSIPPTRRKSSYVVVPPNVVESPCQICGENRVINKSHIIPNELGGSNSDDNLIMLCANHHYLFDQAKLTQAEFSKLNLTGKSADSVEFFNKVRVAKQKKFWNSVVEEAS